MLYICLCIDVYTGMCIYIYGKRKYQHSLMAPGCAALRTVARSLRVFPALLSLCSARDPGSDKGRHETEKSPAKATLRPMPAP